MATHKILADVTIDGTLTTGVDDTGHDVKFFGATSGASFLYDQSGDQVTITAPTDVVALELYTISGAVPTVPQLKIGRSGDQYWGVYTNDRDANIVHRQDESSGIMNTNFQQWDSNTSDTTGKWNWQAGDGNGSSLNTIMILDQAGNLQISGVLTLPNSQTLTATSGNVTFSNAVTATGDINANGNIVGDDSTRITNLDSVGCDTLHADAESTTKITMGASEIACLVEDTDVFQVSSSAFTFDPAIKVSIHKRNLAKTSNTDADADGDIVYFGGTTFMDAGKIYYFNSSGGWTLADADAESTAKGMLAVALGSASNTNGMLIRGMVTLDHDPGTIGDTVFLSTTAGQASSTAPSGNGDIVRVIGYCLDSTNGQIYFNPDGTFVEVTA